MNSQQILTILKASLASGDTQQKEGGLAESHRHHRNILLESSLATYSIKMKQISLISSLLSYILSCGKGSLALCIFFKEG